LIPRRREGKRKKGRKKHILSLLANKTMATINSKSANQDIFLNNSPISKVSIKTTEHICKIVYQGTLFFYQSCSHATKKMEKANLQEGKHYDLPYHEIPTFHTH
jgi:hypothetical protein